MALYEGGEMPKTRAEKAEIIEKLHERAKGATIAIVTNFKGMNVESMQNLRKKVKEQNIHFQVVKNTLARIALKDTPHEILRDHFKDCCAIAFGYDDPVVAAKVLVEYTKTEKNFEVRFGSYEGQFLDASKIEALSKLPGKNELLAQLLGLLNAPATNLVCLLSNLLRGLLYALNGIKEKKEKEGK